MDPCCLKLIIIIIIIINMMTFQRVLKLFLFHFSLWFICHEATFMDIFIDAFPVREMAINQSIR